MNARDTVLGRVRDALAISPVEPVEIPATSGGKGTDQRLELLVDRLTDYNVSVHRCTEADFATTLAAALHPRRPTTLISQPSATSGIELERFEGVRTTRRRSRVKTPLSPVDHSCAVTAENPFLILCFSKPLRSVRFECVVGWRARVAGALNSVDTEIMKYIQH